VSDLGTMRSRIADELRRDDLTSDILNAINTAIGAYQHRRFFFNESRSTITFTTVAAQDIYTSSDAAGLANLVKIDYAFVVIGGFPFQLRTMRPDEMESANLGTAFSVGQPGFYSFYAQALRLYPIPSDAWAVRLGAVVKAAAPASDGETGNPWMTHGERLIRCRAKAEIYAHVIKGQDGMRNAETYASMASEALLQLVEQTQDMTQIGPNVVEAWDPYS
jgi:hypothetical protein